MSTQNNPTFTVELQGQPTLAASFSTEYLNSSIARITLSIFVNGHLEDQRPLEIEAGQEFPIGFAWLRGTLTMSQQAEISFTGNIQTDLGQFAIKDSILAVNNS